MSLCDAINERREIEFAYDGLPRVVQPAAYGTHKSTGNPSLRGYLVAGKSNRNVPPVWEIYTEAKIRDLRVTDRLFNEDPPGYTKGDTHLNVKCEL